MKLHCSGTDATSAKIRVAAAFAHANLEIVSSGSGGSAPQRVVLELPDAQMIGHSNAALRYIAKLNKTSELYGVTLFDSGLVDQWVDFSFMELEIPAAVLTFPLKGWTNAFDGSDTPTKIDLETSLSVMDKHLSSRTFLVGEKLTIADISAVCAVLDLFQLFLGAGDRGRFSNVTRWFMTCIHQPEFTDVIGSVTLCSKAGSELSMGAASASGSGCAASGSSSPKASIVSDISVPAVVPVSQTPTPYFKERFARNRERVKEVLGAGKTLVGSTIVVKGWIKQMREGDKGALAFVELNDGSCVAGLQVVADKSKTEGFAELLACGGVGACIACEGLVVESPGKGQLTEMAATKIDVLGAVADPSTYPLKGKKNSLEFMRENAHLRPRSNLSGAAMRIRNAMAFATHKFFNERGFVYVHTPLITASDCEGAGEMFSVTTLLPEDPKEDIKRTPDGAIDYAKDFFGRRTHLTVSGQLNVETHNCALSDVYTFGPTFRAENSNTTRHLAEFWMIEPEIAFADLSDDMDLAEDFLKYCTHYALTHCREDLEFFDARVEKGLIARLSNVVNSEQFIRLTYTKALEIITQPEVLKKAKFENVPKWGDDLNSEHERYLTEQIYKQPVIITDYPAAIKAFYMRQNPDGKTVAAMDVLVPKIGEIIGGAQREERLDVLEGKIKEMGLEVEDFSWYNDLRKYGTQPHAGFGLGFERLILFITGIENIRDVIPFPRYPGHASF